MEKRSRSPEEILDAIEKQELADEVDRFARLSDREVDRELSGAGVDPETVRSAAHDVFERAMRKRAEGLATAPGVEAPKDAAPPPEVPESRVIGLAPRTPHKPVRRLTVGWIATAAVAASTALFLATNGSNLVALLQTGHWGDAPTGHAPLRPGDRDRADAFRHEAAAACAGGLWKACAAKLDQARDLDPSGESAPEVKAMRRAIEAGNGSTGGGADGTK